MSVLARTFVHTRRTRSLLAVVGLALGSALGLAAPATAAPPAERETVPVTCDNGRTYVFELNGNGAFTPGRDATSTTVYIPVAFSDLVFTATLPDGTVVTESEPGATKGQVGARSPRAHVSCTFSFTFTLPEADGDLPAGTVLTFGGVVHGYLTPAR